jgi:hypothetical protein
MKLRNTNANLPLHDYSNALRSAVGWLGDRYLLAVPIAPRHRKRTIAPLFLQTDAWLSIDRPRS